VVFDASGFFVFSNRIVFFLFTTFLMPLWTLSFATEGLGREREAGNLIWALTRPLSRPAIYLAKFISLLPWCLALNLGGFALLCSLAGWPGKLAFELYWPAVVMGTLAFASLFHFLGAFMRRASVVAVLYAFFLETLAGNLPGHLKRLSLSFYTRCLMFDSAHEFGVHPERPSIYQPVSGAFAFCVLAGVTVAMLVVGIIAFSRKEYLETTT
jgi:ABC-2 type transport system permease protein